MSHVSLRLGHKLNLSLLVFMLLLGTATAVLVLVGFNRSQDNAAARSREGLEREGVTTLQELSKQQAYIGELQLAPAAEWGHQAGSYLRLRGHDVTPIDPATLATAPSGMLYDPNPVRKTDLFFLPGANLAGKAGQEASESSTLSDFFESLFTDYQGQLIEDAFRPIAIYYISAEGLMRYYPPVVTTETVLKGTVSAEDLAQLHASVSEAKNPLKKTIWTSPYVDQSGQGDVLTAYTPVYDERGYRGVIGVDVSLDKLKEQVQNIQPTTGGFSFYIDAEGNFLKTFDYDTLTKLAADGANLAFRAAVDDMEKGRSGNARFELNGREMFVAYAPMETIGGSLALVAPVDEMTIEANGVTDSIISEGNRTLGFIILVMVLLFLLALGSTAWLNRRILLVPIETLVSGTRAVAAGNFNASIPVRSKDELGDLAASFNRMIQEVRTRNDALVREITEREQTARALAEREESARQIFQSVSDAIFITDNQDRIVDANLRAQEMYGYSLEELQHLEPTALVNEPSAKPRAEFLAMVAGGEQARARAVSVRKDGTTFLSSVFSTRAIYFGEQHVLTVVRDITEEVAHQQRLEQRVEERTRELALLLDVSNAVASTLDTRELFALVLDQLAEVVPFRGGSVMTLQGSELVTQYVRGSRSDGDATSSTQRRFAAERLRNSFSNLLEGEPMVVENVRGETAFARDFRWFVGDALETEFPRIVSWMALPMVHKGRFLGIVSVSSDVEGRFTERDANLAMAIANQAAIAIENARLFAETERRALEMTALSRIATTLELEKSLEATLNSLAQRVVESTNAVAASVSTLATDGGLTLGGEYGLPTGFFAAIEEGIKHGAPRPNLRVLSTHEPMVIRDVRKSIETEPAYAGLLDEIRAAEWDTIVIVPMRYGDRDLGTLETYYRPHQTPDQREIGLLAAMARQAATAIENATLFSQSETRVRQLEALTLIASSFSLEVSLSELMTKMAEHIVRATSAVAGSVTLAEGPHGGMQMIGTAGLPEGFAEAMEVAYRNGAGAPSLRAMAEKRASYQESFREGVIDDPRYAEARQFLENATWESTLITPIIYGGQSLGVLTLGYPAGAAPSDEERAFVEAVADQTGLVIENSRLYQRASSAAALEERQRLARELHDSVSQALYGIALGARTARRRIGDDGPANVVEPLDYVLSLAEAGLTEMRALIFELRPESIAQEGLVAAIGRQVASTQARYNTKVTAELCEEPDVSLDIKEALYRIAQESMHNTVKHARATRVDVRLSLQEHLLQLEVSDNGQGFDPSGEFPGHLGLKSMRERARAIGGSLDVESQPGKGTRIVLSVQLD
ncbi:MAG: GAF domain-containing protein [Dehalococcoidia bacterium]